MSRSLVSLATITLVCTPLVALGAIGAVFLKSPNDRPSEFEPIAVDTIGPEPRLVPLRIARRDAWMQVSPEPGGWAFVRRAASGEIVVLSANHTRMGEFLSYDPAAGCYQSDCFIWRYDLDGRWLPEPDDRKYKILDMRRLEHRIDGGQVFVRAPIPRLTYFTDLD